MQINPADLSGNKPAQAEEMSGDGAAYRSSGADALAQHARQECCYQGRGHISKPLLQVGKKS
tara:strand:- start:30 stop:215 length:186 start_codon:yes stop_codon:yes gene_type:complete